MAREILAIAGVFPPASGAGVLRIAPLLSELAQRHDFRIQAIVPQDGGGFYADPEAQFSTDAIEVVRVPGPRRTKRASPLERFRRKVQIPDDYLSFSREAARVAFLRPKPAVLMTFSFPYSSHLAGHRLAAQWQRPWIADLADPWAGHHFRGQHLPVLKQLHARLEKRVVNAADRVTVACSAMSRALGERYPTAANKLRVIENGFVPDRCTLPNLAPPLRPLRLLFLGTLDAHVSPVTPWLNALSTALVVEPDVRRLLQVTFMGGADRPSRGAIRAFQQTTAAGMIRHVPFQAWSKVLDEVATSHGLLLCNTTAAFTAKLPEYLAWNKPVIALVPPGDCAHTLARCGNGLIYRPSETQKLAHSLLTAARVGAVEVPEAQPLEIRKLEMARHADTVAELIREIDREV